MSRQAMKICKEFLRAALTGYTYNLFHNVYALFGLFWGIPVPVMSITVDLYARGVSPTFQNVFQTLGDHPLHMLFLFQPLLFVPIFGAMGTIRKAKEKDVHDLIQWLNQNVEELNKANEMLRELDALKSEFLANVSHELRTPLTTILGYSQLLTSQQLGELSEKQLRALRISEKSSQRLLDMITDLLKFSRMEAGKDQPRMAPFAVKEAIEEVIGAVQSGADEKGIRLNASCPVKVVARGDKDQIAEVLMNLLSNSLKFTEREGRVDVTVEQINGSVQVSIHDTGCGIPEKEQPFIFERFRQADGTITRKHGGLGLGLAIVKQILDAHKSQIRLESKEGVGTTISFDLPLGSTSGVPTHPFTPEAAQTR